MKAISIGQKNYSPNVLARQMVTALLLDADTTEAGVSPLVVLDTLRLGRITDGGAVIVPPPRERSSVAMRRLAYAQERIAFRVPGDSPLAADSLDALEMARVMRQCAAQFDAGLHLVEAQFPPAHEYQNAFWDSPVQTVFGFTHSKAQQALQLPTIKCADPNVPTDSIWWDEANRTWNFGGYQLGVDKVARLMAVSLLRGDAFVTIGEVEVTPDYLYDMVRITGSFGGFVDNVDGDFDPYAPPAIPSEKART